MPVLAAFLGMIVRMFHNDHDPPHIHVIYGEYEAIFDVRNGDCLHGRLPTRLNKIVREWIALRKIELLRAWQAVKAHKLPGKIKPIE